MLLVQVYTHKSGRFESDKDKTANNMRLLTLLLVLWLLSRLPQLVSQSIQNDTKIDDSEAEDEYQFDWESICK